MREVSLAISDVAQNSIDAGARHLRIAVEVDEERVSFEVSDDGQGMDKEVLTAALEDGRSFKGSTGIGLTLVRADAKQFEISSEKGIGTTVRASYLRKDGAQLGDIGATMLTLVGEGFDTVLELSIYGRTKRIDTGELKSSLSVAELQSRGVLRLARENINKFIRQNGGANL
ncbi:MAG: ATP-binding protein [Clostridiales bacterium]|nr:ATP-binding protein [Clostridiales bacterium]